MHKCELFDAVCLRKLKIEATDPVAEFSVSICGTPEFICSSDDDIPRLLIAENDTSYLKKNHKTSMM